MMKNKVIAFFLLALVSKLYAQETYTLDSTILTSRTVISGIDVPWEITWGPDDHIWMTERYGRVSRVNATDGTQDILLDISGTVYQQLESGLLGLALHPDFLNTPYVYIVYTYLSGNNVVEKLERYTYNGTELVDPLPLIENIPGNTTHNGSRLHILPDNTMLMSTGDAQDQALPQNTSAINGKILRINLDGTVPSDNPISGSYVWSWGHRNAQGLWLAPNGIVYSSEHGPTSDDELNIIEPGRNFGWPTVTGFCDSPPENGFCADSNVVEPLAAWTPTIAPSDIIWYNNPAIPEWQDKLIMTVLKEKQVRIFTFNEAGTEVVNEDIFFTQEFGRLRDICVSPDGKIYLATNGADWNNTDAFTHSIIELANLNYNPEPIDNCPEDPNKIEPGECGCGVEEGTCGSGLQLTAGWNLIGSLSEEPIALETALSSIWQFVEVVKDLDAFYSTTIPEELNSLIELEYGKGYFVYVSENCTLVR